MGNGEGGRGGEARVRMRCIECCGDLDVREQLHWLSLRCRRRCGTSFTMPHESIEAAP